MIQLHTPFHRGLRAVALLALGAALVSAGTARAAAPARPGPNVVLVFADDLGYADVGCFGAKGYRTPNLDALAKQGVRLTSFHVAQPVCSASRAALLTGCYPNRIGIHGALGPGARHGIDAGETTLAEVFKQRGYATGMAGKWHLGHRPEFLPTRHGFDEYYGLPYSNDMWPHHPEAREGTYPALPLFENEKIIDPEVSPDDQTRLTENYTQRAEEFIEKNRARPFFFYLAHSMPHVPLFAGKAFQGKTGSGLFADVITEIDASIGRINTALRKHGVERETLVIFTSDNGPWLSYGNHAGSAGPFREGKGTAWEGGVRVPFIARWPGTLPAGKTVTTAAMTIDLLPTLAARIGAPLPSGKIDGLDVWPVLSAGKDARNPHPAYLTYYLQNELQAITTGEGRYKLVLPHQYRTLAGRPGGVDGKPARYESRRLEKAELYDLVDDPGETRDVAGQHPDIVARLQAEAEKARADLGDALTKRTGTGVRPAGQASPPPGAAAATPAGTWNGFERLDFRLNNRAAILVKPNREASGRPWIWRTEFFGHEPQADLALLDRGFHVAYLDVQNLYGGPEAMRQMTAFHAELTGRFGLSTRPVLEGFSRGGLFSLNWAALHPDQVAAVYNDAPVCDFKSWPGGKGKGPGSTADWERCKTAYGLTEEQALAYPSNPIDNLEPLARARIPLLHVCGAADEVVPFDENTGLLAARYRKLGGSITVINKPFCKHHPHSLKDPAHIVRFVLQHVPGLLEVSAPVPATPYGYDYHALRAGLANSHSRFAAGGPARVAFLGGSITYSAGWRDMVCEDLKRRYPRAEFDFINAGIPSLGSTPGAFRWRRDVLARGPVDLLFVEAAVNDSTNGQTPVEQLRGMEGILRGLRLAHPAADIVMLHFADPEKLAQHGRGITPDVVVQHEKVAAHYGVPSIHLAQEVFERIHAGEFTWEKDFKDLHPAPFGHRLYAASIGRLFDAAWAGQPPAAVAAHGLPSPLDPFSYFHGRLIPLEQARLDPGWRLEPRWRPADGAGTRAGFVEVPTLICENPGGVLRLAFEGSGVGVFVASGPDAGAVEYRVDGGEWKRRELFTQWSARLHLPWAQVLAAELAPGRHELELRVAPSSHPESRGHAVRIIHLLAN